VVKGVLEQLATVQTDADAVGANVHAPEFYREAQRLKLQARRSAENKVAKLEQKRTHAKQLQASIDKGNRLTQQDMEVVSELIYKFKLAYEQKDLPKIRQMTQMSSERYYLTKKIFRGYREIDVKNSNLK
jgi:hypothetical protein